MSLRKTIQTYFYKMYLAMLGVAAFVASLTFVPQSASAQNEVEAGLGKISGPFAGIKFDASDPYRLIANVIKLALALGFAIAVLFVIIGGYFYVMAAGNEEQATRGRRTIVYALIGVVVMIMSYVLVNVVINLFLR